MKNLTKYLRLLFNQLLLCRLLLSAIFLLTIFPANSWAQNNLKILNQWNKYKDAPFLFYNHLADQALEMLSHRNALVDTIQTLAGWKLRQDEIRETLMDIVGPFPPKTALNATITRTIVKDFYKVEHIVFESQPKFFVTSSLYLPLQLPPRAKAPAIIYCSGHSTEGYRTPVYQQIILNLVKKGFIVFAFDPVGQGERLEYFDPKLEKSVIGANKEHSYTGAQAFITGNSQARHMIWDGIRAVDYLLTRKEVDPQRIGITGRSGGGTQSAYIAAFDDRIFAAAPECYITNFTRLLMSIGVQDAEQNLFNGIVRGIDHPDFLIARAPKPALVITTSNDFFSLHGARETADQVRRVYQAYGKPENFDIVEDFGIHESTKTNRERMYAFFQHHLSIPGDNSEMEFPLLTNEELRVTESGQVATSFDNETLFSINCREAEILSKQLQGKRQNPEKHLPEILQLARNLSGYIAPDVPVMPVFSGNLIQNGYTIEKYLIQGEGNYPIPYLLYSPNSKTGKAMIIIHPEGKLMDSLSFSGVIRLLDEGYTLIMPDLIGTGETTPVGYRGDPNHTFWFTSLLIGRSVAGIRAGDINRLTQALRTYYKVDEVSAMAFGNMTPVLLHAAAFNPDIMSIILIEPLLSWNSLVTTRFYSPLYLQNAVAGALQSYDLPDLAATLAPRKLSLININNGAARPADEFNIRNELDVVFRTFQKLNKTQCFRVISLSDMSNLYTLINAKN